ncbi:MAG TPA: hypothetical protein VGN72_19675 [Tepidisphaeraceae bacterium]|nr:hypothetical protein [Tepidisphaeraceae bacterium]
MALGDEAAFPRNGKLAEAQFDVPGMTYRQWAAGMALQGLLAGPGDLSPTKAARYAVEAADRLIGELGLDEPAK